MKDQPPDSVAPRFLRLIIAQELPLSLTLSRQGREDSESVFLLAMTRQQRLEIAQSDLRVTLSARDAPYRNGMKVKKQYTNSRHRAEM